MDFSQTSNELRELSRLVKARTLSAARGIDGAVEDEIYGIVKKLPVELVKSIKDASVAAAKTLADGSTSEQEREDLHGLSKALASVPLDPSSPDSLANALDALARGLAKAPGVNRLTSRALEILEKQGLLGRGGLSMLVSLLSAVAGGAVFTKRALSDGDISFTAGPVSFSMDGLRKFSATLDTRNPLWPASAVRMALSVDTQSERGAAITGAEFSLRTPAMRLGTQGQAISLSPYVSSKGLGEDRDVRAGVKASVRFGGEEDEEGFPVGAFLFLLLLL